MSMSRIPTIPLFGGRAADARRERTSWLGPEILVTLFWLLAAICHPCLRHNRGEPDANGQRYVIFEHQCFADTGGQQS
jgi:hypothetical protein